MIKLDDIYQRLTPHQRPSMLHDSLEIAFEAEGNGWTTKTLGDALRSVMGSNGGAGATVYHLRKLATQPAPRTNGHGKPRHVARNHYQCSDHPGGCELCYCQVCSPTCNHEHAHKRYPEHHLPAPMPEALRQQIRVLVASKALP